MTKSEFFQTSIGCFGTPGGSSTARVDSNSHWTLQAKPKSSSHKPATFSPMQLWITRGIRWENSLLSVSSSPSVCCSFSLMKSKEKKTFILFLIQLTCGKENFLCSRFICLVLILSLVALSISYVNLHSSQVVSRLVESLIILSTF